MAEGGKEIWELWYPKAAAAGLSFSRSRVDPQQVVLVHAPPEKLMVEVFGDDGKRLAQGKDLGATDETPMARLSVTEGEIKREDIWPGERDLGRIVLLPGGEAGRLLEWWHAEDHSEWRWKIEFYNRKEK